MAEGTITAPNTQPGIIINTSNTDTTSDHHYNRVVNTVNYTADSTGGDNLGFISYIVMRPNGHNLGTNTGHTCAFYGNAYLDNDGNAASNVAWINAVMAGASGNNGPGTLPARRRYIWAPGLQHGRRPIR